jgi:predicted Zn-dependent protease
MAYVRGGYAQAAMLQQHYVKLIAPDVQLQLNRLSNEIAEANGVKLKFRVHIISDNVFGTFSTGSGDIFVPIFYLDMVENRDEIAFGLAREIAVQHRLIHLKDMEGIYSDQRRNQAIGLISNIVITSAVNTAINQYVVLPVHKAILERIVSPRSMSSGLPGMSVDLQRFVLFQKTMELRQISESVANILQTIVGFTQVRELISDHLLGLVANMIEVANEDADASRRKLKDELGLAYLVTAGFDRSAGVAVIDKIEEYWDSVKKVE